MALLIWLPLSKANSLSSLGLLSKNFLIGGSPVYNLSGKIGGCYSFNGTTDALYAVGDKSWWSGKEISFSVWFKCNETSSAGTIIELFADLTMNYRYDSSGVKFGYYRCYKNASNSRTGDTLVDPNYYESSKWHHIVATFEHQYNRIYVDGVLSHEFDSSSKYTTNWVPLLSTNSYKNIAICRSYGSTSFSGGLINDVRIYDHCLSPKEIKEISKGLVLHYKLDVLQNLIGFDLSTTNYTISNYANRTSGTISNNTYYVTGYLDSTSADTSFSITSKQYVNLDSDTDYYLSFYCKCKNTVDTYFGTANLASTGLIGISGDKFKPTSTVTIGKEYDGIVILKLHTGTDTLYKVCIGFDTPNLYGIGSFIQFNSIALTVMEPSNILDASNNTIYDCSGYGNNGTIIGNISSNVSPRYSSAILMNNTGTTNHIEANLLGFSDNIMSVSFWVKSAKAANHVLFAYPNKLVVGQLSNLMCVLPTGSGMFNLSNFKNNDWNHVVAIRNGNSYLLFINGSLETRSSSNNYYVHNGNKIWLLNRNSNTNYAANATISDVRLYTTVLSEDDIKELYDTSALVDNLGNDYCYLFEELTENIELNPPLSNFNHTYGVSQFDGKDLVFTGNGSSYSNFIEVDTSKTLTYDITYSNQAGSWFLIGFERYDENKTTVTNSGCVYVLTTTAEATNKRISGTVTLSNVNDNPCKFTKIRVLNCWRPLSTITGGIGKIHSFHFTLSSGNAVANVKKQGLMEAGWFVEDSVLLALISKNKYITANQLIEI